MKLKLIKDKKKIEKIFELGSFIKYGSVAVKFYDFNNCPSEYGVSVPKKTFPLAVTRNKIKRRLRNIINDAVKNIALKFDYSYLVIAKPTMLNNNYTTIKETLFKDLEKIK